MLINRARDAAQEADFLVTLMSPNHIHNPMHCLHRTTYSLTPNRSHSLRGEGGGGGAAQAHTDSNTGFVIQWD